VVVESVVVAKVVLMDVCVAQKQGQFEMAPAELQSAIGHQCASHCVVVVVVPHVQGHELSWSSPQSCNEHQKGSQVTVAVVVDGCNGEGGGT
jgi:hypothetical protein